MIVSSWKSISILFHIDILWRLVCNNCTPYSIYRGLTAKERKLKFLSKWSYHQQYTENFTFVLYKIPITVSPSNVQVIFNFLHYDTAKIKCKMSFFFEIM